MSARRRGLCLAGYAGASFLCFPQPVGGAVLDLGLGLAWLAPALLLLGVRGLAPRRAACAGFLAGWAAHAAILHWIYLVTVRYGHGTPLLGVAAVLGLAAYVALFTSLCAGAAAWLGRRGGASPFALAALWTALDQLRGFALTGFPWATLGYAQHANPALMALVPWTGVYGLSFAAVLGGSAALALCDGRRRQGVTPGPLRQGVAALAVLLVLHALGAWLALGPEVGAGESLRVAVLQGNIEQGVKWSPEWAERTLGSYAALTRSAAAEGARLVIWPETAVPGSLDTEPELRERIASLARETGTTLVVGAVGIEGLRPGVRTPVSALEFFDSAYVVDAQGQIRDRYDKTHLVPFGEYVPLRSLIGHFVKAVATGIASGDVTAGAEPRALSLALPGGDAAVSAGVPICYELLFPDLVRRFVGNGAQVLLAITNDAWYGRTGAPYQFLVITALRSAETGVWTARAANTGVSAFIDARGRVRRQTRIFEQDRLVADLPLRSPDAEATFYVRHGDVFARLCWLGLGGALLRARLRPRG